MRSVPDNITAQDYMHSQALVVEMLVTQMYQTNDDCPVSLRPGWIYDMTQIKPYKIQWDNKERAYIKT